MIRGGRQLKPSTESSTLHLVSCTHSLTHKALTVKPYSHDWCIGQNVSLVDTCHVAGTMYLYKYWPRSFPPSVGKYDTSQRNPNFLFTYEVETGVNYICQVNHLWEERDNYSGAYHRIFHCTNLGINQLYCNLIMTQDGSIHVAGTL